MGPVVRGTTSARANRIVLAVEQGVVEEVPRVIWLFVDPPSTKMPSTKVLSSPLSYAMVAASVS
jgi:hypothetical protein